MSKITFKSGTPKCVGEVYVTRTFVQESDRTVALVGLFVWSGKEWTGLSEGARRQHDANVFFAGPLESPHDTQHRLPTIKVTKRTVSSLGHTLRSWLSPKGGDKRDGYCSCGERFVNCKNNAEIKRKFVTHLKKVVAIEKKMGRPCDDAKGHIFYVHDYGPDSMHGPTGQCSCGWTCGMGRLPEFRRRFKDHMRFIKEQAAQAEKHKTKEANRMRGTNG